jgi:hypothetical protein
MIGSCKVMRGKRRVNKGRTGKNMNERGDEGVKRV